LLGKTEEALIAKNEIISKFPESRYASILENPELASEKDNSSPESLYEATYALIEKQDFAQAISKSEEYIKRFDGEPIAPKFELLKATASGRLHGFKPYKKAEGMQAQNLLKSLKVMSDSTFKDNDASRNYKVVYRFNKNETTQINEFVKVLEEVIGKLQYFNLKTSVDVYNPNTKFVVVHGVNSIEVANEFANILKPEDRYKITRPSFGISSKNYQIIQVHKNLNNYLLNK